MRFIATLLAAVALAGPVIASPAPLITIQKYEGEVSGKYIVKLKDSVSKAAVLNRLSNTTITNEWTLLNGFAGYLDGTTIDVLRASPDVEYISEDAIMSTMAVVTQTNAPWGLARISQKGRLTNQNPNALTFSYTFDNAFAGKGVDIYIIDTGVFTGHSQFGGRARFGATFGPYQPADGNGHGTHCAGTAAGSQVGVAKAASIIAVKVLGDDGKGSSSDIISGMDFVLNSAQRSRIPSVVSMSLGGSAFPPTDSAVARLTAAGIHVVVAAGNDNVDAGNTSPARAPTAVTVGATNIADTRASFSNFGSVVDIFAPGENIISSWITGPNAAAILSGTSMATPHVAGLIAYLISIRGYMPPAAMSNLLQSLGLDNVVSGIPAGTRNDLAQNA